ncbi:MAG: KH domain-containing protein [Thermoactinomyces sp.]
MKELIEYIVKALVDHPEQIQIVEYEKDGVTVYKLSVAEEDTGKVIGRQGRIIQAIRTVAKVAAWKENKRIWVEIS